MSKIKVDTEQLRRAENEMLRQMDAMAAISREVESIRRQTRQFTSLEEITLSLRQWENGFEEKRKKQLKLAMALDNIARIYERGERDITVKVISVKFHASQFLHGLGIVTNSAPIYWQLLKGKGEQET